MIRVTRPRTVTLAAVERHTAELSEQLIAWSLEHRPPDRALVAVDVPPVLLYPGDAFVARGRCRDGTAIRFACRVARRLPWRRHSNLIKFEAL